MLRFVAAVVFVSTLGIFQMAAQERDPIKDRVNADGKVKGSIAAVPATVPTIPADVDVSDGLTEREAVTVALWNNAQFNADLSALGFARADLKDAGLLRNPVFSLLFPFGPKQLEAVVSLPIEIFWQRPKRVAAAKVNLQRVGKSLEQNGLNLVREVRNGFVDLSLAEAKSRLTAEAIDTRQRIYAIMQARFREGDISEAELKASLADLEAAKLDQIRFDGDMSTAKERLRLLLGLSSEQLQFEIVNLPYIPGNVAGFDELLRKAQSARPDLRAAEMAIEAAGKRAKWEKSKIFSLIATLDMNGSGSKGFEAGPGITAELPIFNRNQGGISRAQAEIEQATRNYALVQEQIVAEVAEARIRLIKSRELADHLEKSVIPELEREQQLSQASFGRGDIPFLFVLINKQRLEMARTRQADALADIHRASILLDRSIGRIDDDK